MAMTKKNTQELLGGSEDSFGVRLSIAMKLSGDTKSSLARKSGLSEAAIRGYLKTNHLRVLPNFLSYLKRWVLELLG